MTAFQDLGSATSIEERKNKNKDLNQHRVKCIYTVDSEISRDLYFAIFSLSNYSRVLEFASQYKIPI